MPHKSTPYHWLKTARGLKRLIELRGWSKRKFAQAANIFAQDVNKYLSAQLNPENLLLALYEAGEDIEWIKSGGEQSPKLVRETPEAVQKIAPLLGRITMTAEGEDRFEHSHIPAGAGVPFFKGNFFCLEIANDSLINAEPPVYPGDLCIFESAWTPAKGDLVALQFKDNRRIVKVITHASRTDLTLTAVNRYRTFPEVKIKKSELADIGIFVLKLQMTGEAKKRFGLME